LGRHDELARREELAALWVVLQDTANIKKNVCHFVLTNTEKKKKSRMIGYVIFLKLL
jgi:hypothetical protein